VPLVGLLFLLRSWTDSKYKPILSKEVRNALLTFPTTYLCEAGFSALAVIKLKFKNNLDPQQDTICGVRFQLIFMIHPNIEELVCGQHQGIHFFFFFIE